LICRTLVKPGHSMTEPPVHTLTQNEFRISRIFSRAWTLVVRNFWKFIMVTTITELPVRAYFLWADAGADGPLAGTAMRAIIMLLGLVLVLLGQAVLVLIGFGTLRGRAAGLREAVQEASAKFFTIIGLSLVIGLLMVGMLGMIVSSASFLGPGLFVMVFMVAAGMLVVRWSLALPASVVEGLGPLDSLARSARLTRGHRWKVFGIMILICAPLSVVTAILAAAMSFLGLTFQSLGQFVLGVAWITGFNSVLTVIYHDLRVANEGIDSGQIASVFD
jgi:Membrane domain of glycerophosphoryl diester phosphodiesterase